jgi:cytochrome P450
LTDVALPDYLDTTIDVLRSAAGGTSIDLEEVFHELTTQLMGRMAYDVSFQLICSESFVNLE